MRAAIGLDGHTAITLRSVLDQDGVLHHTLHAPIEGTELHVQGRALTNPRAVLSINGDDILRIDNMFANVADGIGVGNASIDMAAETWALEIDIEDASLEDLSRTRDEEKIEGTVGRVLAHIDLFGKFDDDNARRGRGRLIVKDGQMMNSPLTLSIVQLSQLMLPLSASLDFAEIAFTIEGQLIHFDEFLLTAPSIQFVGTGEMSFEDWGLALRLNPRGTVPFLSDLIGSFTSSLYSIEVRGTLSEPETTLVPLPMLASPATMEDRRRPVRHDAAVEP